MHYLPKDLINNNVLYNSCREGDKQNIKPKIIQIYFISSYDGAESKKKGQIVKKLLKVVLKTPFFQVLYESKV